MMPRRFTIQAGVSLAALALVALGPSHARADTATATASAEVAQAIQVAVNTNMDFGRLAPTGTAGTVDLATDGSRTATNVDLLGGGTVSAAVFDVTGAANEAYSITLPASTTLADGAGNSMSVDTFAHDAGSSPSLNGAGSDQFNVGATLHVGANQTAGTYTGTFDVTVSYN